MRIGLALSGGGFRATLYHLGVIRFLHDAGLLHQVSHVTAVSGGSVMAAHLALHWARYTGSAEDFDAAAKEVLDFVRLDVRNRIIRRYPFVLLRRAARWAARMRPNLELSRTGLLMRYYRRHLFGDVCLYELPARPELHLLATSVSEGCLCSFTRSGLILQRRLPGDRVQFEHVSAGLATVPLAVAASSAFPGFFPPIEVHSEDIGASDAAFARHVFTDGGVYDNLGIRAFRFIESCWGEECQKSPAADEKEMKVEHVKATSPDGAGNGSGGETKPSPVGISPQKTAAGFDAVIVSDAGGKFLVRRDEPPGLGLIQTAMRASDILMDRVWQLEREIFAQAPGFVFAPIAAVVDPDADPHAWPEVIQRQVAGIRTDLDRFSPEETRGLLRHGYCVARQACRSRPDLFGRQLPDGPPWDASQAQSPSEPPRPEAPGPSRPPAEQTKMARHLQRSAHRRIWSRLIDLRDPMTYLFVPLVLGVLLCLPYLAVRLYVTTRSESRALEVAASAGPDESKLVELVRSGPVARVRGMPVEETEALGEADLSGFEFLSDGHVVDLRRWGDGPRLSARSTYQYRRLQVRRSAATGKGTHLRLQFRTESRELDFRCHNEVLSPVLRLEHDAGAALPYRWELALDFSKVPLGGVVDVITEQLFRGSVQGSSGSGSLKHTSFGDTKEATMWVLLPRDHPSGEMRLVASRGGEEARSEVRPTRRMQALDGAVVGWQLIDPEPGVVYECRWEWR